jgi:hypothetical protein
VVSPLPALANLLFGLNPASILWQRKNYIILEAAKLQAIPESIFDGNKRRHPIVFLDEGMIPVNTSYIQA